MCIRDRSIVEKHANKRVDDLHIQLFSQILQQNTLLFHYNFDVFTRQICSKSTTAYDDKQKQFYGLISAVEVMCKLQCTSFRHFFFVFLFFYHLWWIKLLKANVRGSNGGYETYMTVKKYQTRARASLIFSLYVIYFWRVHSHAI